MSIRMLEARFFEWLEPEILAVLHVDLYCHTKMHWADLTNLLKVESNCLIFAFIDCIDLMQRQMPMKIPHGFYCMSPLESKLFLQSSFLKFLSRCF
jgi:hypothetical protein